MRLWPLVSKGKEGSILGRFGSMLGLVEQSRPPGPDIDLKGTGYRFRRKQRAAKVSPGQSGLPLAGPVVSLSHTFFWSWDKEERRL